MPEMLTTVPPRKRIILGYVSFPFTYTRQCTVSSPLLSSPLSFKYGPVQAVVSQHASNLVRGSVSVRVSNRARNYRIYVGEQPTSKKFATVIN